MEGVEVLLKLKTNLYEDRFLCFGSLESSVTVRVQR